jgi:hypothetical protein
LSCLVLTPNSLLAQRIDINFPTDYTVAGNGRITADPNYARVFLSGNLANSSGYYSPSTYGGIDDSNNNTIVFHSTTSSNSKYGGLNWPFSNTNTVNRNDTNVALKPLIEASSNTVLIYNNLNGSSVYGAYSTLSDAIRSIVPEGNVINSTFSFCNNRIEVSSFSNLGSIYGSYLSLDTKDDSSNPATVNSSFYLDNNHIVFNSSANVSQIYASYLYLLADANATYNLQNVSMSGNTIQINQDIHSSERSNLSIYAAYLRSLLRSDASCNIQNLSMSNNTIDINQNIVSPPVIDPGMPHMDNNIQISIAY